MTTLAGLLPELEGEQVENQVETEFRSLVSKTCAQMTDLAFGIFQEKQDSLPPRVTQRTWEPFSQSLDSLQQAGPVIQEEQTGRSLTQLENHPTEIHRAFFISERFKGH